MSVSELDRLRRFVEERVADDLGRKARVYPLSARQALRGRLAGRAPGDDAGEFGAFLGDLQRFIAEDLVAARLVTARRELAGLGSSVRDAVALERAAAELDNAALADLVERFRTEAGRQRQAFEDDRTLLGRDVERMAEALGARLAAFAAGAPERFDARLVDVAASAPRGDLVQALREVIESGVRTTFEEFRTAEADRTEQAWQAVAERFRSGTEERVNGVRGAAADLFAVDLPALTVPHVGEERERFFYLFLHVGSLSEPFGRLLSRLLPEALLRRRVLVRARAELAAEFDKHAGRARWDLTQRLDEARRRFEAAMRAELDEAVEAILAAAARAEGLGATAAAQRARQRSVEQEQLAIAVDLAGLAQDE